MIVPAVAADLRITDIRLIPGGRVQVRFLAEPGFSYRLLSGDTVDRIATQEAISPGGLFEVDLPKEIQRFYRVQQVVSSSTVDTDGDTLSDAAEILLGTNPLASDSDGDGWPDEGEVTGRSDPTDRRSVPSLHIMAGPAARLLVSTSAAIAGTTAAQPKTELILSRTDAVVFDWSGAVGALPVLSLLASQDRPLEIVASGAVVARPSLQLLVPRVGGTTAGFGPTLAQPPTVLEISNHE